MDETQINRLPPEPTPEEFAGLCEALTMLEAERDRYRAALEWLLYLNHRTMRWSNVILHLRATLRVQISQPDPSAELDAWQRSRAP